MKTSLTAFGILCLFAITSCSKDDSFSKQLIVINPLEKESLTPQQINAEIEAVNKIEGFNWEKASNHLLWSASYNGDHVISLGFGKSEDDFDRKISKKSDKMQEKLLTLIAKLEQTTIDKILINADPFLNTMDVLIVRQETVIALRAHEFVRYMEPANYRFFAIVDASSNFENRAEPRSDLGCGFESESLNNADYTAIRPNAKVPWTFYRHNIPAAWSYSTGRGITLGIIDTGVSPEQRLLGSEFSSALSTNRQIEKYGTYVDSLWPWETVTDGSDDQCGHGTSMTATVCAARNNNGLPVGVAYDANVVVYRASSDIVLDGFHEQNGVKNAFTALANNANISIISMSMGHIVPVGKIADAIRYAYSKGKLIFCAGGTSTSITSFTGVLFPASMAETIAVTGIKEGNVYQRCDNCHSGSTIEFTVVMQRFGNARTVPVLGYRGNDTDYVGGSSVATATVAGIAALVWSKNPTWSRAQVVKKLRESAAFYPYRNSEFGYGSINALLAVQ